MKTPFGGMFRTRKSPPDLEPGNPSQNGPILAGPVRRIQKIALAILLLALFFYLIIRLWIYHIDHQITQKLAILDSSGIGLYSAPFSVGPGDAISMHQLEGLLTSRPPMNKIYNHRHFLLVYGVQANSTPPVPDDVLTSRQQFVLVYGSRDRTIQEILPLDMQSPPLTTAGSRIWLPPIFMGTIAQGILAEYRPVSLPEISEAMRKTVIASEDRRFYQEPAVDLQGILRAAWDDIRSGSFREGGSTLTQQVVKNLFLTRKKTLSRKFLEAFYALRLAHLRTPDGILTLYLNHIDWGGADHTRIIGIEAASERFFGHPARFLNFRESALLAAILRAPTRNAPFHNPKRAKQIRNRILSVLYEQRLLTKVRFARDLRSPLGISPNAYRSALPGPYFSDWAAKTYRVQLNRQLPLPPNTHLFTSMDPLLAEKVDRVVPFMLARLVRWYHIHQEADGDNPLEAAIVVMNPATGEVLALSGGIGYNRSPFNRAILSKRQPASLFKLVPYLVALTPESDGPPRATLSTWLSNKPLILKTGTRTWRPKNADTVLKDRVLLEEAFTHSLNLPILHLEGILPEDILVSTAQNLGLSTPPPNHLPASWPLGVIPQTPIAVAGAYSIVANGGWAIIPQAFPASHGRLLQRKRILDPGADYLLNHLLRQTVREGTGKGLIRWVGSESGWGGKTGTSNEGRDAWFAAVSPSRVVVVWVGFDDNQATHLTGAQLALPLAGAIIQNSMPQVIPLPPPEGLLWKPVDSSTGLTANPFCSKAILRIPFLPGSAPPEEECSPSAPPGNSIFQGIGHFLHHLF
ncbi:MAG: transglycosylase domain-containing protein [Leptospirales bacterium]